MEFFVALRELFKDDTSWLRIVVVHIFALTFPFIYSWTWFLIDKNVDYGRIIVILFGFDSHLVNSFNYSSDFKFTLQSGLNLVDTFSINDQNRR